MAAVDIAIVSLGTTMGWRRGDEALAAHVEAAGATCELRPMRLGRARHLQRSMALTDVVQGLAARRAAGGVDARAVIYSSITAALLQSPRHPHAIRFDTIAALSRPGLGGAWQRRRERSVLARADLLLPWSEAAAEAALRSATGSGAAAARGSGAAAGGAGATAAGVGAPAGAGEGSPAGAGEGAAAGAGSLGGAGGAAGGPAAAPAAGAQTGPGAGPEVVVLPCVVDVAEGAEGDGPEATAYAANPEKRGLDLLCAAWAAAAPEGARLVVGGIDRDDALRWLARQGVDAPAGVEFAGAVPRERWTALVSASRVYVSAARYEDWGVAQMEALAAGTPLVTVPTPGPNVALPIARSLAPELVASESIAAALAGALRAGLGLDRDARAAYAAAARRALEPYSDAAVRRIVAERVVPALLDRPFADSVR